MNSEPVGGARPTLPRVLGGPAAYSAIVGSVIGSGIFIVPARVAEYVPSVSAIAILWIAGGLMSLAGALTVAELGAMLPSAGGPYVYLKEGFGRLPAFLFGWTEFWVIRAGSVATLASAFALYFAEVVPPPWGIDPVVWNAAVALIAIAILAAVNIAGTRLGGGVQILGTVLKIGAMAAMILLPLPFLLDKARLENLPPLWPARLDAGLVKAMLAAMVGVLWTYDGWINTSALAEEIRDPGRNIPRAASLGVLTLIGLYLGVTLSYHLVLPISAIDHLPGERNIAAGFFERLLGPPGVTLIAVVVMGSIFISLNGNALTGPRAYFAMARDGLFPRFLCRIHPRFQTPANAILTQTVWSGILTVAAAFFILIEPPGSGTPLPGWVRAAWDKLNTTPLYDVLFSYVIFGATLMYALTIATVFLFRKRRPDWHRPYRTWGYPATPLLYLLGAGLLLANMSIESLFESVAGLGIIVAGVPAYACTVRWGARGRTG